MDEGEKTTRMGGGGIMLPFPENLLRVFNKTDQKDKQSMIRVRERVKAWPKNLISDYLCFYGIN